MEDDLIQVGLTAIIEENYSAAIEELTKALNKNDKSYKSLLYRGIAYCNKGEYNKAIDDFNNAEKLRNDDKDDFYYNRGKAYFYNENIELAKNDLNKALTIPDLNEEQKNKINILINKII